jgi:hypothetical protein
MAVVLDLVKPAIAGRRFGSGGDNLQPDTSRKWRLEGASGKSNGRQGSG